MLPPLKPAARTAVVVRAGQMWVDTEDNQVLVTRVYTQVRQIAAYEGTKTSRDNRFTPRPVLYTADLCELGNHRVKLVRVKP